MNSEISIDRHGEEVLSSYSADEKKRPRGSPVVILEKDKGSFSPSGPAHKDALLRELFAYTANWAKRFYRGRQHHDRQKAVESVLRAMLPDSCLPAQSTVSLPDRIHEFMVNHLHQGLTLRELSEFLGYSEKYCSDFFILHMGEPFSLYLKGLRLQTAKLLLKNSEQNLTEIAQAIGFQDQFSFSHFFKKATGISPRQFRETLLQSGSRL